MKLPQQLHSLETQLFFDCTALTAVQLPDSLTSIPAELCSGCKNLPSVTIPHGVTEIGKSAFFGCRALREITVPITLRTICNDSFGWQCPIEVIRLRSDDPAFRRKIRDIEDLGNQLMQVMNMIRTGLYYPYPVRQIHYPLLALHYLHTHEQALAAFIRKQMDSFMQIFIPAGALWFLADLARAGDFFTPENIDGYIETAQKYAQNEIVMLLLNYKNKQLGFEAPQKFRL